MTLSQDAQNHLDGVMEEMRRLGKEPVLCSYPNGVVCVEVLYDKPKMLYYVEGAVDTERGPAYWNLMAPKGRMSQSDEDWSQYLAEVRNHAIADLLEREI